MSSTAAASRSRRPRPALTPDRVVRAAIRLVDRHGLDALSMRRLAARLGVEAMSLYNHVRNKGELLDAMVDVVFSQIDLPTEADWRTAMRQRALSVRQVLLLHPWALALMESRATPGPANLRHHDAVLGSLRRAGFTVAEAAHAYSILDSYIYGFTLTELSLPFNESNPDGVAEVAAGILERVGPNAFPHLMEMAMEQAMKPGYAYGDEFEFGLDLILEGIQRTVRG